jgi:cytochrome c oxidase subunit II
VITENSSGGRDEPMTKRASLKVIIGVTAAVGWFTMSLQAPAGDPPRRIEIVAKRFAYSPAEITLKKGEPVVLVLHSEDVTHGLKLEELNLQTEVNKGNSVELPFNPAQAGDFVGHCSHFCGEGHGGMTLTVHVTE